MIEYVNLTGQADSGGNWYFETTSEYPAGTTILSAYVEMDAALLADPHFFDTACFLKVDPGLGIISQANIGGQYYANNQTGTASFPLPWKLNEESKIYVSGTGAVVPANPPYPPEGLTVTVRIALAVPAT